MTKSELYTFVGQLLNDINIDTTLFDSLLDNAQMEIEGRRPWVILRASDSTQSASAGNSASSAKTLAADFREWYEEAPIQLLDVNNNVMDLREVPLSQVNRYRNSGERFAVDYKNFLFYILGNLSQAYTIVQNYIKVGTLVSAADGNSWEFPVRYHKILGLMIAEKWKNGIDYDVFSNAQANQQAAQALAIYNEMTRWDSRLQNGMTRGVDPFGNGFGFSNELNGTHLI